MTRCEVDHSIFFLHSSSGLCIYLVVYVGDIVINGDDSSGICRLKSHLQCQFQMKDLGPLRYFLGIEIAHSTSSIAISQRKYALDILKTTVSRSTTEVEYRAMAATTSEITSLQQLLTQLQIRDNQGTKLICDNEASLHIASNPIFHERTKHIEIDCHFVREIVLSGEITTKCVRSNGQLADVFTKSLKKVSGRLHL
uniref:Copia protein n=1 Tax=Cajanus cajan TaxID=3821 RepID=A0A151RR42_CAJCA|nr:Copia protein [Cajanus cajan]